MILFNGTFTCRHSLYTILEETESDLNETVRRPYRGSKRIILERPTIITKSCNDCEHKDIEVCNDIGEATKVEQNEKNVTECQIEKKSLNKVINEDVNDNIDDTNTANMQEHSKVEEHSTVSIIESFTSVQEPSEAVVENLSTININTENAIKEQYLNMDFHSNAQSERNFQSSDQSNMNPYANYVIPPLDGIYYSPVTCQQDCELFDNFNVGSNQMINAQFVNYEATESKDYYCADLPFADPITLQYFYNLGWEVFHSMNANCGWYFEQPIINYEQNSSFSNYCHTKDRENFNDENRSQIDPPKRINSKKYGKKRALNKSKRQKNGSKDFQSQNQNLVFNQPTCNLEANMFYHPEDYFYQVATHSPIFVFNPQPFYPSVQQNWYTYNTQVCCL